MYRINPRRTVVALGMSMAIAMVAAAQVGVAQTQPPRTLPANPQSPALNRQQDPQFGSRDDRQFGGQYDSRATRSPEDRLERRLVYLRDQLRITPSQEGAWINFTAALRDEARDRDRGRERVQEGAFDRDQFRGQRDRRDDRAGDARQGPSVVDRLEQRRRVIADRGADLDHVLTALRPLYASFTVEQRRTADRLMFQPRGDNGRAGYNDSRDRRGPGPGGRSDPRDDRDSRDYR
ncbi:MAG TPA: Spy/CpxP family protein refolding chaperone [Micropepsaceae bacterium]|nr:Spy/CpxP family protein refolding chaperone [Micropepsaceae bacterium]